MMSEVAAIADAKREGGQTNMIKTKCDEVLEMARTLDRAGKLKLILMLLPETGLKPPKDLTDADMKPILPSPSLEDIREVRREMFGNSPE